MTQDILEQLYRLTPSGAQPRESQPVRVTADYSSLKLMLDDVIGVIKQLKDQGSFKSTAIYDLDAAHRLQQPIHVVLQESDDVTLASWPELHLYAEGDTPSEAMATLKQEIISLFEDLISTPESELGLLPKRWLRTLKSVLKDNAQTV